MSRRADQVLHGLRADIVSGRWPPGERLTESSLCTAYDVSRVPVREALKQLEVEGFVTAVAYAGSRVAHLDQDAAVDLFAVRATIEELTVRRCAARFRQAPAAPATTRLASRLDTLVAAGLGGLDDPSGASELPGLNTKFHLALAEASGNPSLLVLFRQISAKIEWLHAMDVQVRGPHSWDEHAEIAAAVCAGKVATAGRLMKRHVRNSLAGYLARHTPGDAR